MERLYLQRDVEGNVFYYLPLMKTVLSVSFTKKPFTYAHLAVLFSVLVLGPIWENAWVALDRVQTATKCKDQTRASRV